MNQFHSKDLALIIVPNSGTRMTQELSHGQASPLSTSRGLIFMQNPAPTESVLHSLLCPDPFLLEILYAVFLICLVSSWVSRKSRVFVF